MPAQTVVFDSNVIIPLAIKASRSTRLFFRLTAAGWGVAVTPQILAEVADKMQTKASLRAWLGLSDEQMEEFLNVGLPGMLRRIAGIRQAHGAVVADPEDDMVVAAALEAHASYIITEDHHLLDLGEHQGIKIMTRDAFNDELDRIGVPKLETPPEQEASQ